MTREEHTRLSADADLGGVVLDHAGVNRDARAVGGGDGDLLQVLTLSSGRLEAHQLVDKRTVVLGQLLSVEGSLTNHSLQVCSLVDAEGNLTALDLGDSLSDIRGNGAGLRVRHQTTRAEDTSHAANLGHLVRGSDSSVEVGPAALNLLDQLLGTDEVSAGLFSLGGVLASSEDDNADGLTGAVRQGDSAANQLVSLARVNAQADGNVDGGVVVLGGGLLGQVSGLERRVDAAGVDLLGGGAVCLRVLAHEKSNLN